jgi:hypothetical protein
MAANREETSVGIFEQDTNDDVLCIWTFPGLSLLILTTTQILVRHLSFASIFVCSQIRK